MKDLANVDPLDYFPSVQLGTLSCLDQENALQYGAGDDSDLYQTLMLWWWPFTVLLGPYWMELEQLEPFFK